MPNPLHDLGLMTTSEVARFLGITGERVRQHTKAGDIEAVGQAGRTALYRMQDAEALLALRAERGYKVPKAHTPGEVIDGDASWPPLVVVAS
jgi:hypothetical protein